VVIRGAATTILIFSAGCLHDGGAPPGPVASTATVTAPSTKKFDTPEKRRERVRRILAGVDPPDSLFIAMSREGDDRTQLRSGLIERRKLEHVDDYVKDCAFTPRIELGGFLIGSSADMDRPDKQRAHYASDCHARQYEQNCAHHNFPIDCNGEYATCREACAGPCDSCDGACTSSCVDCRAACKDDDACVTHCAETRAWCHNECLTDREMCMFADCGESATTCSKRSEEVQAKLCPACEAWKRCAVGAVQFNNGTVEACNAQFPMRHECYDWCADLE
jgi:hypothetical protein